MKTKNILGSIGLFIFLSTILFLIFSFSSWNINPVKWSDVSRTFYSLLILVVLVISCIVLFEEDSKK